MNNYRDIIIRPIITEKTMRYMDADNKVTFEVAKGTNKVQIAAWSIAPQILAQIASYTFYALEVNVRASTVLGYVGAGGIGVMLNSSLALLKYERVK